MTAIKLCGLTREEDIEVANALLPDYIGFVFWPRSKRYVTPERAAELKAILDKRIRTVGVFVDEEQEHIRTLSDSGVIDVIQLHGSEDEDYIRKLRKAADKPVIKAFRIKDGSELAEIKGCDADYIMLDAGMGEGRGFDLGLIENADLSDKKIFLAGGLNPDNVTDVINRIHPYAVDVSSGIEKDGVKNRELMEEFVGRIKGGTI